jgi:hypothetical protein
VGKLPTDGRTMTIQRVTILALAEMGRMHVNRHKHACGSPSGARSGKYWTLYGSTRTHSMHHSCKECDGGSKGGSNPNSKDRCGSGKKATINDPMFRTVNQQAVAGSAEDWTKFNPWRAPGNAPVFDACGRAGGAAGPTAGHGEFTNTSYVRSPFPLPCAALLVPDCNCRTHVGEVRRLGEPGSAQDVLWCGVACGLGSNDPVDCSLQPRR